VTNNEERRPFIEWLEQQIQRAGGLRAAADKAGLTHSTLIRAMQGEAVNLRTLTGISKMSGVDLYHVLELYGVEMGGGRQLEATLARMLSRRPELRDALEKAIQSLDDESLEDILRFIIFRTQNPLGT
jgi:ABC-type histidine transport system ATPase subunit